MEKISRNDFYKSLKEEIIIEDKEIDLKNIDLKNIKAIDFQNCNFTSSQINFENSDTSEKKYKTSISFNECSFNNIEINRINNLKTVRFFNSKKFRLLNIFSSTIDSLIIQNNNNIDGKISVYFCDFLDWFNFSCNIFSEKGEFVLQQNTFHGQVSISENTLNKLDFKRQYFKESLEFENTFIENSFSSIKDSEFEKVKFSKSDFSNLTFGNCDFLSTTWFENCKNLDNSELKFVACAFKKYVLFDNSSIHSFEISHSFFERKVSFDSFETNKMKLHQVSFEKVAYFDNLNKSNEKVIEKWDRKTLRAIKRELTNSHNQIDYLRFKAYELNAYKKEIDKNKLNWKDSLILYFNEDSNYFGLDWTKGTRFIFQWSFLFYILYIISYSSCVKDINCIPAIDNFLVNYIKFLNPFSFLKSPIEDAENYFLPFLFFIIGKVFVSYGIYQTVQAFRKFGVNGG